MMSKVWPARTPGSESACIHRTLGLSKCAGAHPGQKRHGGNGVLTAAYSGKMPRKLHISGAQFENRLARQQMDDVAHRLGAPQQAVLCYRVPAPTVRIAKQFSICKRPEHKQPLQAKVPYHLVKALVTGSAGLIGAACVELLCNEGWSVVGIDNDTRMELFGAAASTAARSEYLVARHRNYRHLTLTSEIGKVCEMF